MWQYTWNANGSLKSVKKPSGQTISFEYDALGRRTKKFVKDKTIHYIWSGNVLLHEIFDNGNEQKTATYVYEQENFVPSAKLVDGEAYSIVSDYLGTPIRAYDEEGNLVWERELDIYGKVKTETRESANFVPFRYQGQYYDEEINLCYNRFRYYDCNTGTYISQDPIGLLGNNPNFYAYVFDSNTEVDIFGLDCFKAKKSNFSGVKEASRILKELGLPRTVRKNILESFDRRTIKVRTAKKNEFGIRYYDNIDAFANGRYVFETFPASRNSLALLPEWNKMTYFKQWKIKEGTLLFEGIAAPQKYLQGGQIQKFIVDNPKISLI